MGRNEEFDKEYQEAIRIDKERYEDFKERGEAAIGEAAIGDDAVEYLHSLLTPEEK